MNFSEQPASKEWAPLKYKGESFAEVWFKPEGQLFVLTFRIPQTSFQIPGLDQLLTTENLLKAVGIGTDEVESWGYGNDPQSSKKVSLPELRHPLAPLPSDISHLNVFVMLKLPAQAAVPDESAGPKIPLAKWQNLEARWNTILALEVTIDTLRLRMEALRSEMESALNKTLAGDEKVNASNADVAQWNKAKSRGRYVMPRMKEFIHRATWAVGTPERKKLDELFKHHIPPQIPFSEFDKVHNELEHLYKDRQILSAQGVTVFHECKSSSADIQSALRLLQSNAEKKRVANRAKGKTF